MKFFYGDISVTHFIFAVHCYMTKKYWKDEIYTLLHPMKYSPEKIWSPFNIK
jgi:hypothetical protein